MKEYHQIEDLPVELKNELEELNMLLEKKEKENKVPFNTQAKEHDINYKYNHLKNI